MPVNDNQRNNLNNRKQEFRQKGENINTIIAWRCAAIVSGEMSIECSNWNNKY